MLRHIHRIAVACVLVSFLLAALVGPSPVAGQTPPEDPNPRDAIAQIRANVQNGLVPPMLPGSPAPEEPLPPVQTESEPNLNSSQEQVLHDPVIAYGVYNYDYGYEVAVQTSRKSPVLLTNTTAYDGQPVVSPDGSQIAFISNRDGDTEIFVMDRRGNNVRQLTVNQNADVEPDWSPNGDFLVFSSNRSGNYELYVVGLTSGVQRKLTNLGATHLVDPTFSPDGKYVAFVAITTSTGAGVLCVVRADGQNLRVLTPEPLDYLENPAWSPDGTKIAVDHGKRMDNLLSDLSVFQLDGTQVSIPDVPVHHDFEDHWLAGWTSDGSCLMYVEVEYVWYENEMYIRNAIPGLHCIPSFQWKCWSQFEMPMSFYGWDVVMNYHARWYDDYRLGIDLLPLPSFSREGYANLSILNPSHITTTVTKSSQPSGPWTDTPVWYGDWVGGDIGTKAYYQLSGIGINCTPAKGPANAPLITDTTFFKKIFFGQVVDSRGNPVADLPVTVPGALAPVITTADGQFTAYLPDQQTCTPSVNPTGYGKLVNTSVQMTTDREKLIVLPPADNLIKNGGFEASTLANWQTEGETAFRIATKESEVSSGKQSLQMGQECPYPCLDGGTPVLDGLANPDDMVMDGEHNLHVLTHSPTALMLTSRLSHGNWLEQAVFPVDTTQRKYWLNVGADGVARLIWTQGITYREIMVTEFLQNTWSGPSLLARLEPGEVLNNIVFGSNETVTLLSSPSVMRNLVSRTIHFVTGEEMVESVPVETTNVTGFSDLVVGAGQDGLVHLMARTYQGLVYLVRDPALGWSKPDKIYEYRYAPGNTSGEYWGMLVDQHNRNHFLTRGVYVSHSLERGWTWFEKQEGYRSSLEASIAPDGTLVSSYVEPYSQILVTEVRTNDGTWNTTSQPAPNVMQSNLAGSTDGTLNLLITNRLEEPTHTLFLPQQSPEPTRSAIAQTVTIPAGMLNPTLSFTARLQSSGPSPKSKLQVVVRENDAEAVVWESWQGQPWQLVWADLSPWTGKTVQVQFRVITEAGGTPLQAYLDDITLGSWLTPRVNEIIPGSLPAYDPAAVVQITGENFQEGLSVRLNGEALPAGSVRRKSANLIQITLPANRYPGSYTVSVVNPGGQAGTAPTWLNLGSTIHLPALVTP